MKEPQEQVSDSAQTSKQGIQYRFRRAFVFVKHWFFRYHLLVGLSLLVVGFLAAAPICRALSMDLKDQWQVVVACVGGVLSLSFFVQKQKLEELLLFKELFAQFNDRYDKMNEGLNHILNKNSTPTPAKAAEVPWSESDEDIADRNVLFNYFNLCGEEYLYYRLGYIFPEVWTAWHNGMMIFYENPRIQALWDQELQTGSYYGLQFGKNVRCSDLLRVPGSSLRPLSASASKP